MLRKLVRTCLSSLLIFSLFLNLLPVGEVKAALPNTGAPAGFELSQEITGLFLPTTASFAPDGRVFIAQKDGVVRIYKNGALLSQPFYTIANVNNFVDRGLLGMALHPDFTNNPYVYLLFTYDNNPSNPGGPKTARLIRVTASGDQAAAGSEITILGTNVGNSVQTSCDDFAVTSDCLPADSLSHAPGSVRFAPDGKLLVSVGDGAGYDDVDIKALRAQSLDSLAGKILRINPDGTAPADNPFYNGNPSANRSKVWAMGVRNSFRINIRPSNGQIYLGEVGWNTWEEINYVPAGANLGWPCWEGNEQQNGDGQPAHGKYKDLPECQAMYAANPANLKFPLYTYPHPPSSSAIGGVFYDGTGYPVQYQDVYFFADYSKNQIYNLKVDSSGNLIAGSVKTFASNVGGPVEFFKGPNGDIYYVAINTGSINKISYVAGNLPPVAVANSDKQAGAAPLTVNFTSSGSFDPENESLTFLWDFADGTTSNQANPTPHTFTSNGAYNVVLTVTDEHSNTDSTNITINVGQFAPEVNITSPANFSSFDIGQTVNFSATATDLEDGNLTGSSLAWSAIVHHCPLSDCHNHFLLTATGNSGNFVFPLHDQPFYIELVVTATDSSGLQTSKSVSIYPTGEEISHSILFDGVNDYTEADNNTGLFNQTLTAEAWIKSLSTDSYGGEIVSAGNNWGLRLLPDGNLRFFFNANGVWKDYETTGINIKDGVWHYTAVSKGNGQVKLYVDGTLRATFASPEAISYTYGQKLTVGKHGDLDDNFAFNGSIDEVRLWNSVRSDSDISANYNKAISAQTGLIAYYKMEEGTGNSVVDSSNGEHSLNLVNGVAWTVGVPLQMSPTTNKAVSYSSGGAATVTNTADLKINSFTVETWVRASGVGLYGGEVVSLGNNWGLRINWDGNVRFFTRNAASWTDLQTTGVNVLDNVWHHLAVSRSATQVVIYVDGVARLTSPVSGSVVYNLGNNLVIGKHGDGDVNFNLGAVVDEVRIWNSARTSPEISGNMNSEISPTTGGLLAYLRSNEGSGSSLVDATGRGHTATLSPATAWVDGAPFSPPAQINASVGLDGVDDQLRGVVLPSYKTSVFTMETWVKASGVGLYGGEVVSLGNNSGIRILPGGNVRFFFHVGGFVWRNFETAGLNLLDDNWHYIGVVKDSSSVKIYIDGALNSTFSNSEAISYTLGSNLIAGRHGDLDNRFNLTGVVDEIRIWNSARSTAEISANYNKEVSPSPTLVGYWKLNESSGVSTLDSAGGGNSLSLENGANWQTGFPKTP